MRAGADMWLKPWRMGSDRPCSTPAISSFFITSNSLSGSSGLADEFGARISRDRGEIRSLGLDREREQAEPLAAESAHHSHIHAGAEASDVFIKEVLDLLAGQALGAAHHETGQKSACLAHDPSSCRRCRNGG